VKHLQFAFVRRIAALTERERRALLDEVTKVGGLMPLLMKQRNHQPWTDEDKRELKQHLARLSRISPYLMVLVMPGGFALLPALAWWLDRRRARRVPLTEAEAQRTKPNKAA
jgi:hypothetical protein